MGYKAIKLPSINLCCDAIHLLLILSPIKQLTSRSTIFNLFPPMKRSLSMMYQRVSLWCIDNNWSSFFITRNIISHATVLTRHGATEWFKAVHFPASYSCDRYCSHMESKRLRTVDVLVQYRVTSANYYHIPWNQHLSEIWPHYEGLSNTQE